MNTLARYSITLQLMSSLREHGSWCGETHLQKSMFFLEKLNLAPTSFDFILYKHGPFSFAFHDHLNELLSYKLATLEIEPPYGPRYMPTSNGIDLIAEQSSIRGAIDQSINITAHCLGSKKVKDLEKLGTALLIKSEIPLATLQERAAQLHKYKPHIPLEEAELATRELETSILPCFN